jgi:hypothetical protein
VKAVNLVPSDARRAGLGRPVGSFTATHAIVLILAVAGAQAPNDTPTDKPQSSPPAKLHTLQAEVVQEHAQEARLDNYVAFEKLAQTRVQTVREIAAARFDWHGALADLAKVVPSNTSLQSLTGTVVPNASVTGNGGSATSSVRGDENVPAFELDGCTKTQDDVARLMSQLRLINGVMRVTLNQSSKSGGGSGAGSTSTGGASDCGANTPSFDIVVFFQQLANAGPTGLATATPVSTTAGATP